MTTPVPYAFTASNGGAPVLINNTGVPGVALHVCPTEHHDILTDWSFVNPGNEGTVFYWAIVGDGEPLPVDLNDMNPVPINPGQVLLGSFMGNLILEAGYTFYVAQPETLQKPLEVLGYVNRYYVPTTVAEEVRSSADVQLPDDADTTVLSMVLTNSYPAGQTDGFFQLYLSEEGGRAVDFLVTLTLDGAPQGTITYPVASGGALPASGLFDTTVAFNAGSTVALVVNPDVSHSQADAWVRGTTLESVLALRYG